MFNQLTIKMTKFPQEFSYQFLSTISYFFQLCELLLKLCRVLQRFVSLLISIRTSLMTQGPCARVTSNFLTTFCKFKNFLNATMDLYIL